MSTFRQINSGSPQDWVQHVQAKVKSIRYGSVQIIVHEGRVTQVESLEKTRFQQPDVNKARLPIDFVNRD